MYAVRDGQMLKSLVPLPDAHSTLYGDFTALFDPNTLTPGTDTHVVVPFLMRKQLIVFWIAIAYL